MSDDAARAALIDAVQTNCDIADARHAGDLTLCNYLLQMREFFRWDRGLPYTAVLPRAEVGDWIARRERLWQAREHDALVGLPVPGAGAPLDAFATDAVNAHLLPLGLVYGAGRIAGRRPVFFLAHCHAAGHREGLRVLQAGRELARGLAAPPAALASGADGPVVIRRESLARSGWERYEAFALRPMPGSAYAAAWEAYGFAAGFDAALPRWLEDHTELALLHELGEHRVGRRLGSRWQAMRASLPSRRGELLAAALRDHLADLETTLPALLARGASPSLHAWFAAYDGLREALFPGLRLAGRAWRAGDGGAGLDALIGPGREHFTRVAERILALHEQAGDAAAARIESLLDSEEAVCRLTVNSTRRAGAR